MFSPPGCPNFNSRPREGANVNLHFLGGRGCISIPAPARGRTNYATVPAFSITFQFPPPRGGERGPLQADDLPLFISIPAPARGRTGGGPAGPAGTADFNSRPREGANVALLVACAYLPEISIPAPARGRTYSFLGALFGIVISIPAPARGRTARCSSGTRRNVISIPAPARGRTFLSLDALDHIAISIPAPARGRTSSRQRTGPRQPHFNSRPREGANSSS